MKSEEEQKEAEKQFKDLGEAYAVLSDPKKKQRFDQGMDPEGGMDMDDMFGGGGIDPT